MEGRNQMVWGPPASEGFGFYPKWGGKLPDGFEWESDII